MHEAQPTAPPTAPVAGAVRGEVGSTAVSPVGSEVAEYQNSHSGSSTTGMSGSEDSLHQDASRVRYDPQPEAIPLLDIDNYVRESPPWLLSAVLHMLALILLAIWLQGFEMEDMLVLDATFAEEIGEQLEEEDLNLEMPTELEIEQSLVLETLPPVEDPLAMPELAPISPVASVLTSNTPAEQIGIALKGRELGSKQALLKEFGGTASTEQAVMEGLKWLQRNQRSSGAWSLQKPYSDGASVENEQAATAMALLAFQGAGYTPKGDPNEPFIKVVSRGWNWLLASQDDTGEFFMRGGGNHRIYTNAQCAIALCELFAMTRDEKYRDQAQLAVDWLVETQASAGGWRYDPGQGSDLSVTGWVLMALQSARMAGLEVPSETFRRVSAYLDLVSREGGSQYAYMEREGARISMTAEGLLCRQYLGWRRDDDRLNRGVEVLLDNLPEWRVGRRSAYYWYYATQVLHHMEGTAWEKWNRVMRQLLPENQIKRGSERGSWSPAGDRWGQSGGRLYVTCLSIYTLEVYYRHLPIYRRGLLDGGL